MLYQPYTYSIRNKITGEFYYGAKFGKNANPDTFWVDYFTSSKLVHEHIEKYGKDAFEFKIRRLFKTSDECVSYEQRVIRKIIHNKFCLNKCVLKTLILSGNRNPSKKEENKNKISIGVRKWIEENQELALLNRKKSKQAMIDKGTHEIHSKWMLENNPTKNTIWVNNGKENLRVVYNDIPLGYNRGRLSFKIERLEKTCPHCNKTGKGPNMTRYHFENCKKKEQK